MSPVITTIIGLVGGILKDLIMTSMKHSQNRHDALMEKAGLVVSDRRRAGSIKDTGVAFTRRLIALAFVGCLVVAPVVFSFIYPDSTINVPKTVLKGGFWIFSSPKETLEYVQLSGITYVLYLIDMLGLIIGYYFGSGGTRRY
jgi:hypothetical protein